MTDQEKIEMLRDVLKQFQYAAHEFLPQSTDKLRLAVKMGDQALATTAPNEQKPVEKDGLSAVALSLYKPPFKFIHGYVYDSVGKMVADNNGQDVALRIRGWGHIGGMENAAKVQDKVGELIAEALTKYWQARAAMAVERT